LSVPVLAAFGGVILFVESITMRLASASVMVLGGIAIALNRTAREGVAAAADDS